MNVSPLRFTGILIKWREAWARSGLGPLLLVAALGSAVNAVYGQGGPPMITDDPGTPGDGHWELNTALTIERGPGAKEFELPLLDLNFGIGERLQLKYEAAWVVQKDEGDSSHSGASNSLIGVKWRFYDAGETGWQISIYPQFEFRNPGSHSVDRGLAERGTGVILPFQFQKDFGKFSVNFDVGHVFRSEDDDEWFGGVAIGRDITQGIDVAVEIHADGSSDLDEHALTAVIGARFAVSQRYSLLVSIGRELQRSREQRATLLAYLGWQIRL